MTTRSSRPTLSRRASLLTVTAIATVALTACSTGTPSNNTGTESSALTITDANDFSNVEAVQEITDLLPEAVKSDGQITVAMNLSTPPNKFLAEDGATALGTNPDLARLIGRVLGVDVSIQNVEFDGIIPGLQSERFNLSIASMGVTDERTEVLDMIDYATWGSSAVTLVDSDIDIHALCGFDVGAQQGALQLVNVLPELSTECEEAGEAAINIISLPSQQDALTQLASGRLDVAFGDTPVMAYAVLEQDTVFRLAGDEINPLPVTLSTKKGSEITPALLAAMEHIVTMPEYADIFEVWGLPNAVVSEVKVY